MVEKYQKPKFFYESVRKTLYACRIAGFLPIAGLLSNNQLSRCSLLYNLYCAACVTMVTSGAVLHIYDFFHTERPFKDLGDLAMQCFATVGSFFLLKFAFNWKDMLKKIEDNERLLPPLINQHRILKNINRCMLWTLAFGIVTYLFHFMYTVRIVVLCYTKSDEISMESYFTSYFAWYFDNVPFNYGTAFLVKKNWADLMRKLEGDHIFSTYNRACYPNLISLQTTFLCSFIDAIVVVVSLYLVYRFRNFNRLMRLKQNACIHKRHTCWSDLQAHYTRLSRLVKIVDDNVNPFVFLSFLSSLVFICKIIYEIIQKHKNFSSNIYNPDCTIANSSDWIAELNIFTQSMYFLFKSASVSLLTAHLHSLSRVPLNTLHTLPASAYNLEVQRFMDQVYHSKVSLSGLKFFYVTQGTILSMLSTIITYELVILQFQVISN